MLEVIQTHRTTILQTMKFTKRSTTCPRIKQPKSSNKRKKNWANSPWKSVNSHLFRQSSSTTISKSVVTNRAKGKTVSNLVSSHVTWPVKQPSSSKFFPMTNWESNEAKLWLLRPTFCSRHHTLKAQAVFTQTTRQTKTNEATKFSNTTSVLKAAASNRTTSSQSNMMRTNGTMLLWSSQKLSSTCCGALSTQNDLKHLRSTSALLLRVETSTWTSSSEQETRFKAILNSSNTSLTARRNEKTSLKLSKTAS